MVKKILINVFLVVWLIVMAIDPAPQLGQWHQKLQDALDPYLDVSGLWQGRWLLFAPEPDKVNIELSAEITFPDGAHVQWHSPKWRTMSAWDRFLRFRESEFVDNVRRDVYRGVWPTLSDYLSRTVSHPVNPQLKPSKIVLTRHWIIIPPPNAKNVRQFPEPPEPNDYFAFYKKEYRP